MLLTKGKGETQLCSPLKAQQEQNEARENLRKILPPGTKVHAELAHVSRSGMMRHIRLFAVVNCTLKNITFEAAKAMGEKPFDAGPHWVIKMGGCGTDMCFATVYNLSSALYGHGAQSTFRCIGKGDGRTFGTQCPSNDHSNDYRVHNSSDVAEDGSSLWDAERVHSDGGYALRYERL